VIPSNSDDPIRVKLEWFLIFPPTGDVEALEIKLQLHSGLKNSLVWN
jgi:hypothetical protein